MSESSVRNPVIRQSSRLHPLMLIASGFGTGYAPFASGTVGTLPGVALSWALLSMQVGWLTYAVVTLVLLAIGVPVCSWAARRLGKSDPSVVVWDELASVPIVFFLVPLAGPNWWWVLLVGFLAHRFFDVLKPWPIHRLERLPGGWGIMADDVLAAVYALVVLRVAIALFAS